MRPPASSRSLLEQTVLPAETERTLLERAGGNPLYAEEFVRLLADREQVSGVAATIMPDTVQALIAARLDTLSPGRKSLLQDASVVGKVFWSGALAELGGGAPLEVERALHELSRKELVRPTRMSSMEGEAEYGFWHAVVRDVCYAQIPRVTRAARHVAAAAWIEDKAGERVEDLAEVLAHHYVQARELVLAWGRRTRGTSSGLLPSAISLWQANGRSPSTSTTPRPPLPGRSRCAPRPIRRARACSSAGLARRYSRAACTRRERRSRTRSTSIGRMGTTSPSGGR